MGLDQFRGLVGQLVTLHNKGTFINLFYLFFYINITALI